MFLSAFLLSLLLFPHFSCGKQLLVELKSGKNKMKETNIGNGTGDIGNGNGTDARQKNEEGKNQSRPKPDHKKVKNGDESQLTTMKTTSESRLTTTDKISQGEDYFLEFVLSVLSVPLAVLPSWSLKWCPRRIGNNPNRHFNL